MNFEKEREKIASFSKIGILVLGSLLLLVAGLRTIPKAVSVATSGGGRKIPIYCVDCKENKVALSFDAAWGNGKLG